MRVTVAVPAVLHCWLCGTQLRVLPAGGPSYCEACEAFTGTALPANRDPGLVWSGPDGRSEYVLFTDYSVVHQPSPA